MCRVRLLLEFHGPPNSITVFAYWYSINGAKIAMHHGVYIETKYCKVPILFRLIMSETKLAGLVRKYLHFMDKGLT